MEFENDELSDQELDGLLRGWKIPQVSPHLRAAIFPEPEPWWKRTWTASFRVPVPVAFALVLVAAFIAWRWHAVQPAPQTSFHGLQPVAELRPRIIRSGNVQN